jgi:hypothetical protein
VLRPFGGHGTDLRSYALSLDGDKAIFKPTKAAHNQIWLLEPEDASAHANDDHIDDPIGTDSDSKPGQPVEVVPGLKTGDYNIKSKNPSGLSLGTQFNQNKGAFDIVPYTEGDRFTVTKTSKDTVTIYRETNDIKVYLAASGGEVASQMNSGYNWQIQPSGQGDFIIIDPVSKKTLWCPRTESSQYKLVNQAVDENTRYVFNPAV